MNVFDFIIFIIIVAWLFYKVACWIWRFIESKCSKKSVSKGKKYSRSYDGCGKNKRKEQRPPDKDYSEINKEIEEIVGWIGVSEPVNTSVMFEKVLDGKEKEVIDEIANQLSLPMKITTKYISKAKHNEDGTSPLAEVVVGNIPHYGSKNLKDYPCNIMLYPGYNSRPDRFIYVIAHELCHYVLQSLRPHLSDDKKEERLTDLAVIFGGFESAYRTGWQSRIHGNAGYYLDEYDITYIRRRYESMLVSRRQEFEKISNGYGALLERQADRLIFIKNVGALIEHPDEKIMEDDIEAIGRCLSSVGKKEVRRINKLEESLDPFLQTKTRYGEISHNKEDLKDLDELLKGIILPSTEDISVLMKYTDKYATRHKGQK